MDLYAWLALVGVGAFVVLVVYLVLTLIQLRRTLVRIDEFVVNTDRELTPLLASLRESSERLKEMLGQLQQGVRRAEGLLEAIGEVGDTIHAVNDAIRNGVHRYLDQILAMWAGIKTFSKFFRQHHTETEEGE